MATPAISLRDVDRLDRLAALELKQPFSRSVLRLLLSHHFERSDLGHIGKPTAERLAEVGHGLEVDLAGLVDPLQQLGGTKAPLSESAKECFQRPTTHAKQVALYRGRPQFSGNRCHGHELQRLKPRK